MSKTLWERKVPFLYCHCVGLIGWIRVQLAEHTIIESHPDSIIEDLRLDDPFPDLVNYMNSITLTEREEAVNTPWLVLLYKTLQAYVKNDGVVVKKGRNGNNEMETNTSCHPNLMSSAQKQQFKGFVRECMIGIILLSFKAMYRYVE